MDIEVEVNPRKKSHAESAKKALSVKSIEKKINDKDIQIKTYEEAKSIKKVQN
jgi:hypothetical protein